MANAEIKTVLTADAKPLESAFAKAQNQAGGLGQKIGSAVSSAGGGQLVGLATKLGTVGLAIAAVKMAANAVEDYVVEQGSIAERLNVTSSGLGITTKELQAFGFAAKQAGNLTQEELTTRLWKLQDSVEAVATGDKGMTDAFARFGITAKQAVSMTLPEILERIAKGAQNSGTAVGDLNQIFGRGSAQGLTAALQDLAKKGFDGLSDSAERAGQVIEDSTLKRLETAKDRIEAFNQRISNFWTGLAGNVLGVFESPEAAQAREQARSDQTAQQDRMRQERAAQLARTQAEAAKKIADQEAKREEQKQERITKLREKQNEPVSIGNIQASDALARIGAISGGRSGLVEALAKQQVEIAKRQADIEKNILEVLKNG